MKHLDFFNELKEEFKTKGMLFRWNYEDALESFREKTFYFLDKAGKSKERPENRCYFNTFFAQDESELVSYISFVFSKKEKLPENLHSRMILECRKNPWSKMYFRNLDAKWI
jgi:hypothetical protein